MSETTSGVLVYPRISLRSCGLLAVTGYPPNEPVTEIIVSHSRGQSSTVTVIPLGCGGFVQGRFSLRSQELRQLVI